MSGIDKVGHLIETIKTAVEENGIDPFCEVAIRVGPEHEGAKFLAVECLAVKRTVTGLKLIIQARNPS